MQREITKWHCALGLLLHWLGPSGSERAQPISAFWPEAKTGEVFSPIGAGGLSVESGRPVDGGRRWSGRGASRLRGGLAFGVERGSAYRNRAAHGSVIRVAGSDGGGTEELLRPPEGWSTSTAGLRRWSGRVEGAMPQQQE
jgi:hypothetical protein